MVAFKGEVTYLCYSFSFFLLAFTSFLLQNNNHDMYNSTKFDFSFTFQANDGALLYPSPDVEQMQVNVKFCDVVQFKEMSPV